MTTYDYIILILMGLTMIAAIVIASENTKSINKLKKFHENNIECFEKKPKVKFKWDVSRQV